MADEQEKSERQGAFQRFLEGFLHPVFVASAGGLGTEHAVEPLISVPARMLAEHTSEGQLIPEELWGREIDPTDSVPKALWREIRERGVSAPVIGGPSSHFATGTENAGYFARIMRALARRLGEDVASRPPHIMVDAIGDPAVLLHEAGHATPISNSKVVRNLWMDAQHLGRAGLIRNVATAMAAAPVLVREPTEESGTAEQLAYKGAPWLVAAMQAPTLAEEGRAWGHALADMRRHGMLTPRRALNAAGSFGTYLAGAAAPVIGTLVARELAKRLWKQRDEEQAEKTAFVAGKEIQAPGSLKKPAEEAWRVGGNPPKPKTTPPVSAGRSARAKSNPPATPPSNAPYFKDVMKSLADPARGHRITLPKAGG